MSRLSAFIDYDDTQEFRIVGMCPGCDGQITVTMPVSSALVASDDRKVVGSDVAVALLAEFSHAWERHIAQGHGDPFAEPKGTTT